ncbi:ComEA family DNA-binding protein [Arcanobacterium buesumense]|uniref:ComEA family DNA-binding protein n=1 Tax=Arcanobacterium buesumense TaxID=2722751 RepID=A0A6H2EJZ7_9ACTO|nr:ComEA family DNA-binding protein [Arcanobacterium buesumense]QJC21898.1 ComEA family DNA-binding protein [Arcanobacterium buesumense]
MSVPPPRRRHGRHSNSLRRSPRTKIGYIDHQPDNQEALRSTNSSRIHALTTTALKMGAGEDISALSASGNRLRIAWAPDAARVIAIVVVFMTVVVIVSSLWQGTPTVHASPGGTQSEEEKSSHLPQNNAEASTELPNNSMADGASAERNRNDSEKNTAVNQSSLVVYVSGAVHNPGVVTVNAGSRINDVVMAAGGLTQEADLARINLAATVTDGEHIHVLGYNDAGVDTSSHVSAEQTRGVDVNSADANALEAVPGIGPATAQAIIRWRESHGKFTQIDQLTDVPGIGPKSLDRLREHLRVG